MTRKLTARTLLSALVLTSAMPLAAQAATKPICIRTSEIDHTSTPDDRTILFHMRHNKVWKNTLVNECAGLKNNANGFVYEPTKQVNGEICENFQSIILADNGNTCLLGSFTEVSAR